MRSCRPGEESPELIRRSERDDLSQSLVDLIDSFGTGARWRWMIRSARLLAPPDGLEGDQLASDEAQRRKWLEEAEKKALDSRSWWKLLYNLACYHAQQSKVEGQARLEVEAALDRLETALSRPGCEGMGGAG